MDSESLGNFLSSINEEGNEMFHHETDDCFNDDTFTYFLNSVKSDPIKMKTLLLKEDGDSVIPFDVTANNRLLHIMNAILDTNEGPGTLDIVLMNENDEGENIFHHVADDYCNDDMFVFLLNFIKSDPMKIKTLVLKKDNNGRTPFDLVMKKRLLNKLKAILGTSAGTEILENVLADENVEGRNIFHQAADIYRNDGVLIHLLNFIKNDPKKMQDLLLKKDMYGDTPIDLIIKRRQLSILKAVYDTNMGASIVDSIIVSENTQGRNIFHTIAGDYGNDDMFIYLLDSIRSDAMKTIIIFTKRDINGDTPLDVIVKDGHVNMLKAVLDTSAGSEILNSVLLNESAESRNLFYYAADDYDNENVFICLLNFIKNDAIKLKALLTKKDITNDTPLDVIVKKRLLNRLKAVLDTSLGPEILECIFDGENEGRNIFHHAADAYCNDGMLIYLLNFMKSDPVKLKAFLHKKDVNGDTPFDVVVKNGQMNVMKAILDSSVGFEILKNALVNENVEDKKIFHTAIIDHCDNDMMIFLMNLFSVNI